MEQSPDDAEELRKEFGEPTEGLSNDEFEMLAPKIKEGGIII